MDTDRLLTWQANEALRAVKLLKTNAILEFHSFIVLAVLHGHLVPLGFERHSVGLQHAGSIGAQCGAREIAPEALVADALVTELCSAQLLWQQC